MSQKVLFYQEDRPKTADGLWMHKDSDGNMKLDYVGNNTVYPVLSAGGVSEVVVSENSEYEFDATKNYSTGDVVIKDGKLYEFTSNHSAGEWDATEVSETDLLSLVTAGGSGSGSTSDAYKPYLKITPSSEWEDADPDEGLTFTSAADAAQSLGINEQDFLKLCSSQMPMIVDTGVVCMTLGTYAEALEDDDLGYIVSFSKYTGISGDTLSILAFKDSSEANDSTKQYFVSFYSEDSGGSIGGGPK